MRNLITIISLVFCISCTTRSDYFADMNKQPVLTLINPTTQQEIETVTIYDTLKMGSKYSMMYMIDDEEELSLIIENNNANDSIIINESIVFMYPRSEGLSTYKYKVIDTYKSESTEYTVSLFTFINKEPSVNADISIIDGLSPYEIEIDLSQSFDNDAEFGGEIVEYEYKIQNNYILNTHLPQIRYIFDTPGQKKIIVRAKDNDGVWSKELIEYIVI